MITSRPKPSVIENRNAIAADVAAYLANGGEITCIDTPEWPAPRRVAAADIPGPSAHRYHHERVLEDTENWRPIPGFDLYRINRRGEVWSIQKQDLMPVTVRSRRVRLSPGGHKNNFVRPVVDDLVREVFGHD